MKVLDFCIFVRHFKWTRMERRNATQRVFTNPSKFRIFPYPHFPQYNRGRCAQPAIKRAGFSFALTKVFKLILVQVWHKSEQKHDFIAAWSRFPIWRSHSTTDTAQSENTSGLNLAAPAALVPSCSASMSRQFRQLKYRFALATSKTSGRVQT